MGEVTQIKHPLLLHKLGLMRKRETTSQDFRMLLEEISVFLAYEITRDAPSALHKIKTPLESMQAPFLIEKFVLVSILRAGEGLLRGMMKILPNAKVGHIGIYRNPDTLQAVEYYFKMPKDLENSKIILLDPMLATGNSAVYAIERLKKLINLPIKFVSLLSSPNGIKYLTSKYPDVDILTVFVDRELNQQGYILPGLGDAGDRMFHTK